MTHIINVSKFLTKVCCLILLVMVVQSPMIPEPPRDPTTLV